MEQKNYTQELDSLKARHDKRVAGIRADKDLTEDARHRKVDEAKRSFDQAYSEEKAKVEEAMNSDRERLYRQAHAPDKPSSDTEAEVAKELRLGRIRQEVEDEFSAGRKDPVRAYEEAVRLGDGERMTIISKVGPKYLKDAHRKERLSQLAEENLPEPKRRAKEKLAKAEAERADVEIGLALRERARGYTGPPRGPR